MKASNDPRARDWWAQTDKGVWSLFPKDDPWEDWDDPDDDTKIVGYVYEEEHDRFVGLIPDRTQVFGDRTKVFTSLEDAMIAVEKGLPDETREERIARLLEEEAQYTQENAINPDLERIRWDNKAFDGFKTVLDRKLKKQ